jgi:type II secretory pathway pseudopilin PulG
LKDSRTRSFSATAKALRHSPGFTLLESLLAIGILVTVFSQIVGVQASSLSVARNNKANIQATWALRSLASQIEYIVDVRGVKALPTNSSQPPTIKLNGEGDDGISFQYTNKQALISASKFLQVSMNLGMNVAGGGAEEGGNEQFKQFGELLDSQLPKDIYRSIKLTALWKDGETQRSTELGMLLIDRKSVHIGIPGLTQ